MPVAIQFILGLLGIASDYLSKSHNKTAQEIGAGANLIDAATLEILQLNAKIKGLQIDWSDPAAVQAFIATIPTTPLIPDPTPANEIPK